MREKEPAKPSNQLEWRFRVVKRYAPFSLKQSIQGECLECTDGNYVTFADYQKLLEQMGKAEEVIKHYSFYSTFSFFTYVGINTKHTTTHSLTQYYPPPILDYLVYVVYLSIQYCIVGMDMNHSYPFNVNYL